MKGREKGGKASSSLSRSPPSTEPGKRTNGIILAIPCKRGVSSIFSYLRFYDSTKRDGCRTLASCLVGKKGRTVRPSIPRGNRSVSPAPSMLEPSEFAVERIECCLGLDERSFSDD